MPASSMYPPTTALRAGCRSPYGRDVPRSTSGTRRASWTTPCREAARREQVPPAVPTTTMIASCDRRAHSERSASLTPCTSSRRRAPPGLVRDEDLRQSAASELQRHTASSRTVAANPRPLSPSKAAARQPALPAQRLRRRFSSPSTNFCAARYSRPFHDSATPYATAGRTFAGQPSSMARKAPFGARTSVM